MNQEKLQATIKILRGWLGETPVPFEKIKTFLECIKEMGNDIPEITFNDKSLVDFSRGGICYTINNNSLIITPDKVKITTEDLLFERFKEWHKDYQRSNKVDYNLVRNIHYKLRKEQTKN